MYSEYQVLEYLVLVWHHTMAYSTVLYCKLKWYLSLRYRNDENGFVDSRAIILATTCYYMMYDTTVSMTHSIPNAKYESNHGVELRDLYV
jgi:hypothetical protein